jgi:NADH dehydrogenase [ubiquinone] 1 alpha subcomplex assembly factor 1
LKTIDYRNHEFSSLPLLARNPVAGRRRRWWWVILPAVAMSAVFATEPRPVLDFRDPTPAAAWAAVDDRVMGGVSASRAELAPEGLVFHGTVSLAHGGGFASIRAQPREYDLAGATALVLRVQGDGRTYKFGVRTDDAFDGVQYQARFATTPGEWLDVEWPVTAFQPTFRGRVVPDAPDLDPARIRVFGFLIAERQAGPFRLVVESIRARF